VLGQLVGLADPVHAHHEREVTRRPASTPASASSNTAAWLAVKWSSVAAARNVSGAGLPCSPRSFAIRPSTRTSNRSASPAESRICLVLALDDTMAVPIPFFRTERM
jgi:hypothetical protein